jgi:hypothetical protein
LPVHGSGNSDHAWTNKFQGSRLYQADGWHHHLQGQLQ